MFSFPFFSFLSFLSFLSFHFISFHFISLLLHPFPNPFTHHKISQHKQMKRRHEIGEKIEVLNGFSQLISQAVEEIVAPDGSSEGGLEKVYQSLLNHSRSLFFLIFFFIFLFYFYFYFYFSPYSSNENSFSPSLPSFPPFLLLRYGPPKIERGGNRRFRA